MLAVPIKYDILNGDITNSSDYQTYKLIKIQDKDVITTQSFIDQLLRSNVKPQLALGFDYSSDLNDGTANQTLQINENSTNISDYEPKPEIDPQTIDKVTGSIISEYELSNDPNSKRLGYYDINDVCKGNEACLRDLKFIKHLRTFDAMFEWIFDNANILAIIQVIIVWFILVWIYKKNSLVKVDSIVAVNNLNQDNRLNTEVSRAELSSALAFQNTGEKSNILWEDMLDFWIDRADKLNESDFELKRRISNSSAGGLCVNSFRKDSNASGNFKNYIQSPISNSNNLMVVSKNNSLPHQLNKRHILHDGESSPIIEEKSRNCSPSSPFKNEKMSYAIKEEKQSKEEYYIRDDHILEVTSQTWIKYFEKNPTTNQLVLDRVNSQNKNLYIQTNLPLNKYKSIQNEIRSPEIKKESDFEDKEFLDFTKGLNEQKRNENHYLRSKRSKTFKEDDPDYFLTPRKTTNHKAEQSTDSKYVSAQKESILVNIQDSNTLKNDLINTIKPEGIQPQQIVAYNSEVQMNQPVGRVITYTKTDYRTNLKQESRFVQNKEDIEIENRSRGNIPSNYTNIQLVPHQSQLSNFPQIEAKKPSLWSDSEKVKELSNISDDVIISDDQHSNSQDKARVIDGSNSNTESIIKPRKTVIEEVKGEDEKISNQRNYFDISKSSISQIPGFQNDNYDLNDETETYDNSNMPSVNIDKYISKDSSLYKQLMFSHSNSFKYIKPIGKGGFGSVIKVMHILDNNFYAIKKIKLHLSTDQDIKTHKVFREVQMMTRVNHVNVSLVSFLVNSI